MYRLSVTHLIGQRRGGKDTRKQFEVDVEKFRSSMRNAPALATQPPALHGPELYMKLKRALMAIRPCVTIHPSLCVTPIRDFEEVVIGADVFGRSEG